MASEFTTHTGDVQPNPYAVVTGPGTVRIERLLPGPVERVWTYLTDSAKRGTWLARGEMDLRIGGHVEHIFHDSELTPDDDPPPEKHAQYAKETRMTGRILALDPPHRITYSWFDEFGESEVRFELNPVGDKVHLVLTHSHLDEREQIVGTAGGWHVHLDILEARLSGREPGGFWRSFKKMEAEYEVRMRNEELVRRSPTKEGEDG